MQSAPASEPNYGLALVPVGASKGARSPPPKLLRGSPGLGAQTVAAQSSEPEAGAIQQVDAPRRAQRSAAPPRPNAQGIGDDVPSFVKSTV